MTHVANKNPFKNQGLAIFVTSVASFGKRFDKKKLFKIKEMPRMARIVGQNGMAGILTSRKRKKRAKGNVNEM